MDLFAWRKSIRLTSCVVSGGWEAAVLALHSVLPSRPAEDQGAEEGLRLV